MRANPCRGRYAGCTRDPVYEGGLCAPCRLEHASRQATRVAAFRKRGLCSVCGRKAVALAAATLSVCRHHRRYYADRWRAVYGQ